MGDDEIKYLAEGGGVARGFAVGRNMYVHASTRDNPCTIYDAGLPNPPPPPPPPPPVLWGLWGGACGGTLPAPSSACP